MPNWLPIALGVVSLLTSIVALTAFIITMRANIDRLKDADGKREKKEEAIDRQVFELLGTLREFMAAQTQINVTVKAFIEGQTDRNEKTADLLNKLAVQVETLSAATKDGTQIISLLAEVLRKAKVIYPGPEISA